MDLFLLVVPVKDFRAARKGTSRVLGIFQSGVVLVSEGRISETKDPFLKEVFLSRATNIVRTIVGRI